MIEKAQKERQFAGFCALLVHGQDEARSACVSGWVSSFGLDDPVAIRNTLGNVLDRNQRTDVERANDRGKFFRAKLGVDCHF